MVEKNLENTEDINKSQTGINNESDRESLKQKISQKASALKVAHGDNFDEEAFVKSAEIYAQNYGSIDGMNAEAFMKNNKNEGDKLSSSGKGFGLEESNGKFIARGTDGTIIEGKDFRDLNYKVCENLKQHSLSMGKEPIIRFMPGKKHSKEETEKRKEIFASDGILKLGITLSGGYPEDPKFWSNLKEEYFKNPENTKENWDKMTRLVPDEIIGRDKEKELNTLKLNEETTTKSEEKTDDKSMDNTVNDKLEDGKTSLKLDEKTDDKSMDKTVKDKLEDKADSKATDKSADIGKKSQSDTVLSKADIIKSLRNGVNPKLAETLPKEKINKGDTKPREVNNFIKPKDKEY